MSGIKARGANIYADFLLSHLRPDMAVLDCGCGQATITMGLAEAAQQREGPVRCRERMGGLLRYYHREAA